MQIIAKRNFVVSWQKVDDDIAAERMEQARSKWKEYLNQFTGRKGKFGKFYDKWQKVDDDIAAERIEQARALERLAIRQLSLTNGNFNEQLSSTKHPL